MYDKLVLLILAVVCVLNIGCSNKKVSEVADSYKPSVSNPINDIAIKPVQYDVPITNGLGSIKMGELCLSMAELKTIGGKAQVSEEDFTEILYLALSHEGYKVFEMNRHLQDNVDSTPRYLLVSSIRELDANICFPNSGFRSWKFAKGESNMTVNWKLYSYPDQELILERNTRGSSEVRKSIYNGSKKVFQLSFADAVVKLMKDEEFADFLKTK